MSPPQSAERYVSLVSSLFESLPPLLAICFGTLAAALGLGIHSGDPVFYCIAACSLCTTTSRLALYLLYRRRTAPMTFAVARRWNRAYGVVAIGYACVLAALIFHCLTGTDASQHFVACDLAVLYASQSARISVQPWIGLSAASVLSATLIIGILAGGGPIMTGLAILLSVYFIAYVKSLGDYKATVDQRMDAQRDAAFMAGHDRLTGLANRSALVARLEQDVLSATEPGQRLAVHYLDLDRFKAVNDSRGHAEGDALLRAVAACLEQEGGPKAHAARIGGDEFVVVQADPDDGCTALDFADRLRMAVGRVGQAAGFTASIGVSFFPDHGATAEALLQTAEIALGHAKTTGRSICSSYDPAAAQAQRRRQRLQTDLQMAVRDEALGVVYQPQATVNGLAVVGFEALVRWTHPELGEISPAEFIPLAEDGGFIKALGALVLEAACREAATWGNPLSIAVNLSAIQVMDSELPATVAAVLDRTGLCPSRLELEITESVFISDTTKALAVLGALKGLGVRIAMDDFGTGYASLSYLQIFPFDKIKIDRSFISDLEGSQNSRSILRAIICLGSGLGVPTLAEGVETAAQRALLLAEGCTELQGYHLGRPLPIASFARWTEVEPARVSVAA